MEMKMKMKVKMRMKMGVPGLFTHLPPHGIHVCMVRVQKVSRLKNKSEANSDSAKENITKSCLKNCNIDIF